MPTHPKAPTPPETKRKSTLRKTSALLAKNRLAFHPDFRHQKFFNEPEIKPDEVNRVLPEARRVCMGELRRGKLCAVGKTRMARCPLGLDGELHASTWYNPNSRRRGISRQNLVDFVQRWIVYPANRFEMKRHQ
jgi:hypothetical protein